MRYALHTICSLLWMVSLVGGCGGGGGAESQQGSAGATYAVLRGTVAVPDTVSRSSEAEPNDTVVDANRLPTVLVGHDGHVQGTLDGSDKVDFYWFDEGPSQRVTVELTCGSEAEFELAVFDVPPKGPIREITWGSPARPVVYQTPLPAGGHRHLTLLAVVRRGGEGVYRLSLRAEATLDPQTEARTGKPGDGIDSAGDAFLRAYAFGARPAAADQILVRFRRWAGRAASERNPNWADLTAIGEVPGQAVVFALEGGRERALRGSPDPAEGRHEVETAARILRLRSDPDIAAAIPNYLVRATIHPNDPLFGLQWHLPLIAAPEAWELATGSEDVVIAVLDTGIAPHGDFGNRLLPGYDFVSDPVAALDGDGIDPDPTDPGDGGGAVPDSWHGTHVAGIIGAATDNGIGVAGVDWASRILPVRVLGLAGAGTLADVLNGILYAAGLENDSGEVPDRPADIINMSFGSLDPDGSAVRFSQPVFDAARQAGCVLVAAAGNDGSELPSFPASSEGVIAVGAVDSGARRAWYSNAGPGLDLVAPGGESHLDGNGDGHPDGILSAFPGGLEAGWGYAFLQGTSMAAPQVAGVAALCLAANPALSLAALEEVLLSAARDLGVVGRDDHYGYGMVDAHGAVQAALAWGGAAPPELPPLLAIAPLLVDLGANDSQRTVSVSNLGGGMLQLGGIVTGTNDGGSWLQAALESGSTGAVRIEVDRGGLLPGEYSGWVRLESNGGAATVSVDLIVAPEDYLAASGAIRVRLLDALSCRVLQEVVAEGDGMRGFAFPRVETGHYLLVAGTDRDGDGDVCQAGDFCAGYPGLDQLLPLSVGDGAAVVEASLAGGFLRSDWSCP